MNKTILITGTSTGIGKLTVPTLAADRHRVIAAMRDTTGKNKTAAEELAAIPNVEVIDIDVADDHSVQQAVSDIIQRYGTIDVLVNNAAVIGMGVAEAYELETIKAMFEINFYGVIRAYQAILPAMRQNNSGLIINLSTGASGFAPPYMAAYVASKFAVEAWNESINSELRSFNIENVSVPCGVYPTGMAQKGGYNAGREQIIAAYPDFQSRISGLGTAMFGKMAEFQMDTQTVADGVKALIDMPAGTRPLRFPLDAIAQGADVSFINMRADIKKQWAANYGMDI